MSLIEYVETRPLNEVDRQWAALSMAILKSYIESGCCPEMDDDWYKTLCFLSNVNPNDLRKKIEYIYGPLEEE